MLYKSTQYMLFNSFVSRNTIFFFIKIHDIIIITTNLEIKNYKNNRYSWYLEKKKKLTEYNIII